MSDIRDKYAIGKFITAGSQAKIFKGYDTESSSQTVIMKIINTRVSEDRSQKILTNIFQEITVLKKLSCKQNPYVVKYIDDYEMSGSRIIIMEDLTEWMTLENLMKKFHNKSFSNRINPRCLKLIITNLLRGMDYIHKMDIIHNDVKPENIMIDREYNIKYIDFGLSGVPESNDPRGTPLYFPPETPVFYDDISDEVRNLDPEELYNYKLKRCMKHDIWSLGIIIYQLCNLSRYPNNFPYNLQRAKDLRSLITILRNDPYEYPSTYLYEYDYEGVDFNKIVELMLDPNPETRPTISSLISHIESK